MRLLLVGGVLTSVVWTGGAYAAETKATGCDAMVGVWEYLPPSAPGHAIIAKQDGKYLGVFAHNLPAPETAGTKASAAGPRAAAGAWEFTCEGSAGELRMRLRWLYSSFRPQDVGSEATLEVEVDGSQARWWSIGADGKRGAMGAGRLLK
jgi:hypothetical protein